MIGTSRSPKDDSIRIFYYLDDYFFFSFAYQARVALAVYLVIPYIHGERRAYSFRFISFFDQDRGRHDTGHFCMRAALTWGRTVFS